MTAITYTATRKLISGHTAGTEYDLETRAVDLTPKPEYVVNEAVAVDGTAEALLDRVDDLRNVTTNHIALADLPAWQEFLASVAARETFTFDAFGTIASPDNPEVVEMKGKPSIVKTSQAGKFQITFTVRPTS